MLGSRRDPSACASAFTSSEAPVAVLWLVWFASGGILDTNVFAWNKHHIGVQQRDAEKLQMCMTDKLNDNLTAQKRKTVGIKGVTPMLMAAES